MQDRIYCTTDDERPGYVRLTATLPVGISQEIGADGFGFADPRVAWFLKVRSPELSLRAVAADLAAYRYRRTDYYKCSPEVARAAAIQHTTVRATEAQSLSSDKADRLLLVFLSIAYLLGLVLAQSVSLDTAGTIGLIATVLCALTTFATLAQRRRH